MGKGKGTTINATSGMPLTGDNPVDSTATAATERRSSLVSEISINEGKRDIQMQLMEVEPLAGRALVSGPDNESPLTYQVNILNHTDLAITNVLPNEAQSNHIKESPTAKAAQSVVKWKRVARD